MSIAGGASILLLLLLLTPAVVGVVLIVMARRRGRGYPACGGCGYDVSGSVGEATRCPECGEAFTKVGIQPPEGRRRPVMMGVGIALVAFVVTCFGGMFVMTFARASSVTVAPAPTATAVPAAAPAPVEPVEPVPGPAGAAEPAPPAPESDRR